MEHEKQINLEDIKILELDQFKDARGSLCPIEFSSLPIEPKRIFYVYGVSDTETRGRHAHFETNQILICLKGQCLVTCKDGFKKKSWTLNTPSRAIFIPKMIWDDQVYMTKDTVLLVISDTQYDKRDYIESWEEYQQLVGAKKSG